MECSTSQEAGRCDAQKRTFKADESVWNKALDVERCNDFEADRFAVQGFVVDYFTFRLRQSGLEWDERPSLPMANLTEYEAMRNMGIIFEKRHCEQLSRMVVELSTEKHLSFQRYIQVVEHFSRNEDESEAQMSYGRLVALISFGGLMVTHLAKEGNRNDIAALCTYTAKFLEKRIQLSWHNDGRSWANFLDRARAIEELDRKSELENAARERVRQLTKWSLIGALFTGLACIGAFVITRSITSK